MAKDLVQFMVEHGTPEATGIALAASSRMSIGKLIPVKQINNITYSYNKETSLGGVARRVINQNFPMVAGSVVTPLTEQIAILGGSRRN